MFLHSWVLFPVVAIVLSTGAGLLAERAAGRPLPGPLLVPTGFALVVVVASLFTYPKATAPLSPYAVAVVALAGFILGWARFTAAVRRVKAWLWPAVAALLPAGMISLPVLLTGEPGFTGYGRIVDLAYQLEWAAYLQSDGQSRPEDLGSSFLVMADKLTAIGYPFGGQAALGTLARDAFLDPIWAWQPFMAGFGAVLGLSIFYLLRPAIEDVRLRAVAAGIAAQPTILFSYALGSGIKEVGGIALIVLSAALLVWHRPGDGGPREVIPLSIALAAAVSALSIGAIPWIGMFALILFIAELRRPERSRAYVVGLWAWATVLAMILAAPAVSNAVRLAPIATSGGPEGLGNLAAPVPFWSTVGVWMTPDHRYPLGDSGYETLTIIGIALGLALALLGLVVSIRRGRLGLAALGIAGIVALAYVARASGDWSDFKAFTITAPMILTLSFAGAAALAGRWRWAGIGAGAVLALGIVWGNLLVYHSTSLAPYDRLRDLQQIAERYDGQGPSLYPVFEEYGEYLLRDMGASSLSNPANNQPGWGPNARMGLQFVRDPDEYTLDYMNSLRTIVLRRDPTASRPPGNWRLVETTPYHEIWQPAPGGPRILAHVGFLGSPDERTRAKEPYVPECTTLREALRDAPDDARVRYATEPQLTQLVRPDGVSRGWLPQPPDWNTRTPGQLTGSLTLPVDGRYSVWLRGSVGRRVHVLVDGREIGSRRWEEAYPGNYMLLDNLDLDEGQHRIEVRRGGGRSILPGVGNDIASGSTLGLVGPVAFLPEGQERIVDVPRDEAMDLCEDGETLMDWMEIVEPS